MLIQLAHTHTHKHTNSALHGETQFTQAMRPNVAGCHVSKEATDSSTHLNRTVLFIRSALQLLADTASCDESVHLKEDVLSFKVNIRAENKGNSKVTLNVVTLAPLAAGLDSLSDCC